MGLQPLNGASSGVSLGTFSSVWSLRIMTRALEFSEEPSESHASDIQSTFHPPSSASSKTSQEKSTFSTGGEKKKKPLSSGMPRERFVATADDIGGSAIKASSACEHITSRDTS